MEIIEAASPNFDDRNTGIDLLILHYTGMPTGKEALDRMRDPAAKVSAHYMIEEDARVFRLVDEDKRAWHAGVSSWRGETNINARSIGIEIVNPGHEWGYSAFPDTQIDAVVALAQQICRRHGIEATGVLAHSDIAPRRKEDPGEKFPWDRLAEKNICIGAYKGDPSTDITYEEALTALREIGYDAPSNEHAAPVLAFQRRFIPGEIGKALSPLTKAAMVWVSEQYFTK